MEEQIWYTEREMHSNEENKQNKAWAVCDLRKLHKIGEYV